MGAIKEIRPDNTTARMEVFVSAIKKKLGCNYIGVYNNRVVAIKLIENKDLSLSISIQIISEFIRCFIDRDSYKAFINYMSEKRMFYNTPHLSLCYHMFENGQRVLDGTGFLKKRIIKADYNTGEVQVFEPFRPEKDNKSSELKRLIQIICETPENYEMVESMMAQYCFESRRDSSGRCTLVCYGKRGTGKGMLVEKIFARLLPGLATALPANFMNFNTFIQNKLVILDENENKDYDHNMISRLAKRISGGINEVINPKGMKPYSVKINAYFAIMSNQKPVEIKEFPEDEKNNQWICLQMNTPLHRNPDFLAFRRKYGPDLTQFIEDNLGGFIRNELWERYQKILDYQKDGYRYGFPIYINDALNTLSEMTKYLDGDSEAMLETLLNTEQGDMADKLPPMASTKEVISHWQQLQFQGVLTNYLIKVFCDIFKIKPKTFKTQMVTLGYSDGKSVVVKIRSKPYRGLLIDVEKFYADMKLKDITVMAEKKQRNENLEAINAKLGQLL